MFGCAFQGLLQQAGRFYQELRWVADGMFKTIYFRGSFESWWPGRDGMVDVMVRSGFRPLFEPQVAIEIAKPLLLRSVGVGNHPSGS